MLDSGSSMSTATASTSGLNDEVYNVTNGNQPGEKNLVARHGSAEFGGVASVRSVRNGLIPNDELSSLSGDVSESWLQ